MIYDVLSNVQHDGKFYPHGSTINVEGDSATRLLELGVIKKPDNAGDDQEANSEYAMSLDDAFEVLQSDIKNGLISEADAYTKSGMPDCAMLSKYAGREISSKERGEWWDKRQKDQDGVAEQE